jgi:hypothetical protein
MIDSRSNTVYVVLDYVKWVLSIIVLLVILLLRMYFYRYFKAPDNEQQPSA